MEQDLATLCAHRERLRASLAGRETVGDNADQAQAVEAAMELERVERRIADLTTDAAYADAPGPSADAVSLGSVATLRFPDGGEERVRLSALPDEDADPPVTTPDSPMGRALLGRRTGDPVSYEAPYGEVNAEIAAVHLAVPRRR
ncbi:MAG: GreA/GreB family elongation factor [Streptosporangiales bacterium]|nr:GreA/GreB family elongation factor [Streptosporangiales bacterium]MBO0892390.1 GreA/GreB family elongation factor [Acidothermales bacterium]